ncbi:hypothetical protein BCR42DRAFT_492821 [Absidia repens]|uniref:Carrier domain-containing protein n=1 Tax=Absidia repens TaxID=90262 RepID=A0A1X2ID49_9FUNG|nr:hypothetical protein BCR42DRAFT_492821 [Absidia repens]
MAVHSLQTMDQFNRSKHSLSSHPSTATNSTCVSRPTSTHGGKIGSNNFEHVLNLLEVTFKGFLSHSNTDRPEESLGSLVNRTLQFDTLLDFIDTSDEPAIVCQPSSSPSKSTSFTSTTSSTTYLPSNSTSTTTLSPLNASSPLASASSFITYSQMHSFILNSFNLAQFNLRRGARVAVCLPQGPSLGLCLISIMAYCTCAPSNDTLTPEELLHDYKKMQIQAVVVPNYKLRNMENDDPLVSTLRQGGLQLIGLETETEDSILFTLHADPYSQQQQHQQPNTDDIIDDSPSALLNQANDTVMILQTSGTSGTKKVVPYLLQTLCVATTCVSASYGIKPTDMNINMMPLYHVGGVVRSLLTPIFTTGIVVLCKGFDAGLFWDILERQDRQVWYFAVPTMHQAILQEGSMRKQTEKQRESVKMVCNAGGDLLPMLANRLKAMFPSAVVLPSYGMTECLPISAPPRDYDLSRSGTSGLLVGPDLMIAKDDRNVLTDGVIGHIMVRGFPCFGGYEGVDKAATFNADGWFDTGDTGYMKDGYLYITGRSKEIINRGGEVISPFEIEEILMSHPKVAQTMVFSVPHETLQETIGAVIVTQEGNTRPDLRSLRLFMEQKLHQSKLPQVLVYMDGLPRNNVNKVMRIQFSNRLDMPMFMDAESNINATQRLYEATCPPNGTPLTEHISKQQITWSIEDVNTHLTQHPQVNDCATYQNPDNAQIYTFIVLNDGNKLNSDTDHLISTLREWLEMQIHDYMQPRHMIFVDTLDRNSNGMFDDDYLYDLCLQQQQTSDDPIALTLRDVFAYVLGLAAAPSTSHDNDDDDDKKSTKSGMSAKTVATATNAVTTFPIDGDFFEYGGNSLKSGFLISQIRARLGVVLPVTILYEDNNKTPIGLAGTCREKMAKDHPLLTMGYDAFRKTCDGDTNGNGNGGGGGLGGGSPNQQDFGSAAYKARMAQRPPSGSRNLFNPFIMLFQLSPLCVLQPMQATVRWFFFAYVLSLLASSWTFSAQNHGFRLVQLVLSLCLAAIAGAIVFPLVAILVKWVVIGRYRAGSYPLWGQYYLRWWFVQKVIDLMGHGIFEFDAQTYGWYLWLMGAKVGKNCQIDRRADIQEYDLLTFGDGCVLETKSVVRPFTLSTGRMNLDPIVIGDNCVVGLRSFVVAGSTLAPGTAMAPLTSSFPRQLNAGDGAAASINTPQGMALADLSRASYPGPHVVLRYLVCWPIVFIINLISNLPWLGVIFLLTNQAFFSKSMDPSSSRFSELVLYFAMPKRVGYHMLAVAVRKTIVPIFYLLLVILFKRGVIGEFKAGPRRRDQLSLMRYWLMEKLLPPGENLQGVASIIGTHYEPISMIYRLLGAKVGKRVYWPGSGLNVVEYDLLTIGDDVIFGSRSHILCSDANESLPISIGDGAMMADNCVLLPGSSIGRHAVLGSGGLLKKNFGIADHSTWFGAFNGNAIKFRDGVDPSKSAAAAVANNKPTATEKMVEKDTNGEVTVVTINKEEDDDQKSTIRPFGRAFYQRKATYFVIPLFFIVPFNILVNMFASIVWAVPVTAAIQVAAYYQMASSYQSSSMATSAAAVAGTAVIPKTILTSKEGFTLLVILGVMVGVMTTMTFLCLSLDVASKWMIFGRRKQGQYNWDESSYCQRWQFLIAIQQTLRHKALNYIGGSAWIVLYFRGLGCRIGKRVCLYPNGGDPMMTEPDLVTMEDDVAVDNASLICHLNTLGQFSINPLRVGAGSVLRTGSRLAAGATMMEDCTMLEHTLIISGEVADRGSMWQGYPAANITDELDSLLKTEKTSG